MVRMSGESTCCSELRRGVMGLWDFRSIATLCNKNFLPISLDQARRLPGPDSLSASHCRGMLFKGDKFAPSGFAEYLKLFITLLSGAAQVGLNIALAVLIGAHFRDHAPWAFYLVIALACAWSLGLLVLISSLVRLVRFLNKGREVLQTSKSSLVLPLGAESLAAALGSALLSSAVVWISKDVKDRADLADQERYGQFDIYFPISIGFQILALPGFVKLADIFGYAQAKAKRELQNALLRADGKTEKKLNSVSTGGSLISAESIRAAQKEIGLAKARLSQHEKALQTVSTGGSAQTVAPQRAFTRPLVPTPELAELGEDRRDRLAFRHKSTAPEQQLDALERMDNFDDDLEAQRDPKLEIYSSLPTKSSKPWYE